jgi:hypothetical protein
MYGSCSGNQYNSYGGGGQQHFIPPQAHGGYGGGGPAYQGQIYHPIHFYDFLLCSNFGTGICAKKEILGKVVK